MEIKTVKTKPEHLQIIALNLREEDRREIEAYGYSANKALWRSYKDSMLCYTVFVGKEIAAVYGVGATPLDNVGTYLAAYDESLRERIAVNIHPGSIRKRCIKCSNSFRGLRISSMPRILNPYDCWKMSVLK